MLINSSVFFPEQLIQSLWFFCEMITAFITIKLFQRKKEVNAYFTNYENRDHFSNLRQQIGCRPRLVLIFSKHLYTHYLN